MHFPSQASHKEFGSKDISILQPPLATNYRARGAWTETCKTVTVYTHSREAEKKKADPLSQPIGSGGSLPPSVVIGIG